MEALNFTTLCINFITIFDQVVTYFPLPFHSNYTSILITDQYKNRFYPV